MRTILKDQVEVTSEGIWTKISKIGAAAIETITLVADKNVRQANKRNALAIL